MEINKSIEATIKSGLRSVAASFPAAASIAQAWNEYENHIQFKRIEESCCFLLGQHCNIKDIKYLNI